MTLALTPAPAPYRNVTGALGVDKLGGALVGMIKAAEIAYQAAGGTGWRCVDWGDGVGGVGSVLGVHGFTSGGGYATAAAVWSAATGGGNTISNCLAWVCLGEYVSGVATGRQITFQRSSTTSAGGERLLNVMETPTPCTGVATTTTPRSTGGNQRFVFGTAFGAAGSNLFTNGSNIIGTAGTHCWTVYVAEKAVNGRVGLGFLLWGSSAATYEGGFLALPLSEAATTDPYPWVTIMGQWLACFGGTTAYNATPTIFGASSANAHALDASGTWRFAGLATMSTADAVTRPGSSGTVILADKDGCFWLLPIFVTLDNVTGAQPEPKGRICDAFKTAWVANSTHRFPTTIHSSVLSATEQARTLLGQVAVTGEVGYSPTWTSTTNQTTWKSLGNDASPDAVAPVLGSFTPSAGAIAYNQSIAFPVPTDTVATGRYVVTAEFATRPDEIVWDGASQSSDYSGSFPSSGTATVTRTAGWPAAFTLKVQAVDAAGNWATAATAAYTISTTPNPAAADTSAPVVTLVSPANGRISKNSTVVLDVTDNVALGPYMLIVEFDSTQPAELLRLSTYPRLKTLYNVTVVSTTGGDRLTFTRTGGWPKSPRFYITPVDAAGNVG